MRSSAVSCVPGSCRSWLSTACLLALVAATPVARGQATTATGFTATEADAVFSAAGGSKGGPGDGLPPASDQREVIEVDGMKVHVERLSPQPVIRQHNGRNVGSAIRIWAEILSGPDKGRLVNVQRYKWSPNQEFRLHVQSAYPLSMAVFQSFPEDRPPTRQVVPVESVPETFSTIPAGSDYAVPYKFVTDNDQRDETIQLVFVRADSRDAPQQILRERRDLRRGDVATEISKGFSKASGDAKLRADCLDDVSRQPVGAAPTDVGIIFLSPGFIHHGQVTLNK